MPFQQALRTLIAARTVATPEQQARFEGALQDIAKLGALSIEELAQLLGCLSEQAEYDEFMWSLLHAAEAQPHATYVPAALLAVPALLRANEHEWASTVLLRLVNDARSRTELVASFRGGEHREAVELVKEMAADARQRLAENARELLRDLTLSTSQA